MDNSDHAGNEDILNDALHFFGVASVEESTLICYGPLKLTTAPKEGKANTLLADHLFSPALLLAERIERGLLSASGQSVLELGSGTALPSLLLSTMDNAPSVMVVTDYPDDIIMGNLEQNIERNRDLVNEACTLVSKGYRWGDSVGNLLSLLPNSSAGYDVLILSDLLHFDSSHDMLLSSIEGLLGKTSGAIAYISAGKYTKDSVCEAFLIKARKIGLHLEEQTSDAEPWQGVLPVTGLDRDALSERKAACRFWIGHWDSAVYRELTINHV